MSTVASPSLVKVKMAGLEIGRAPTVLETLLGSCVGVAIWDRRSKQGGLAHIVLPDSHGDSRLPGKFADTAIAALRSQLIARGCSPASLTAKIAGGSTMFGKRSERDVGEKNHRAVTEHLRKHNIHLVAEHIGGDKGRIIQFSLEDGRLTVRIGRELVGTI
jgi:chemotaxis protein CheD